MVLKFKNRTLLKIAFGLSACLTTVLGLMLFSPQLSFDGYVEYDLKTGELRSVQSNPVKSMMTTYTSDVIVEKTVVYSLPPLIDDNGQPIEVVGKQLPLIDALIREMIEGLKAILGANLLSCSPAPKPVEPAPVPNPVPGNEIVDWGTSKIGAHKASDMVDSSMIKVCVLDTGIDLKHPDLQGVVLASKSFVPGEGVQDTFGHGTHVAGTIAAKSGNGIGIKGGSKAQLLVGKVLGKDGSGDLTWIANGMRWCQQMGAHVVSESLGSNSESAILGQVAQDLAASNILMAFAAGNDGRSTISYPARYAKTNASIVAVLATTVSDTRASFSNYEAGVNSIGAPGTNIYSTVPIGGCSMCGGETKGYMKANGTSMATPNVSAAIALMLAAKKEELKYDIVSDKTIYKRVNALSTIQ